MFRKDREVTDVNEIFNILDRCETVRVGVFNGEYPYIVPMSFGAEVIDGKIVVYFHGAKRGLKIDCLENNPKVCIEADIFIKVEETHPGITARYESVIGFGAATELSDDDKLYGLKKVLEHYGHTDFPLTDCRSIPNTRVYKVVLDSVTGKKSLSK